MSHNMPKEKNPQEKKKKKKNKNTNSQSFAAGQWQTGTKIQQVNTTPAIVCHLSAGRETAKLLGT